MTTEITFKTDDLRALYEDERLDGYNLIAKQYVGEWRWGNIYLMVFEFDGDGPYGVEIRESSGDADYITFDDHDEWMPVKRVVAKPVTTVTYEVVGE